MGERALVVDWGRVDRLRRGWKERKETTEFRAWPRVPRSRLEVPSCFDLLLRKRGGSGELDSSRTISPIDAKQEKNCRNWGTRRSISWGERGGLICSQPFSFSFSA